MKLSGIIIGLLLSLSATSVFAQETTDKKIMVGEKPATNERRTEAVKIGETAPDFTLTDLNGNQVMLSAAVKKSPVVLVFYRGYWCPFCARQLGELRNLLKDNEKIQLYAISIDAADKTAPFKQKIEADSKGKINYTFLSDAGAKTIDAYGLRDEHYKDQQFDGIPHPTILIVDKKRVIRWAKISDDYKVRPKNDEIRTAIDGLK